MTRDQTDTFRLDEGDNWFRRNEAALDPNRRDYVIDMAVRANEDFGIRSVCELGCSNGWRLAALAEAIPALEQIAGSDVSAAAIDQGKVQWPGLDLRIGSLDQTVFDEQFDLVIVSFVLHWVARERLCASIDAIDALVRDRGALIVADFLPDAACARRYHHRTDVEIFTYKQDYVECFTRLGIYAEIDRQVFSQSGEASADIDPQDRAVCVLLRKSI